MAYVSSDLHLPSLAAPRLARPKFGAAVSAWTYLRKRWAYRRMLAHLERYSERQLLDIGAFEGADAFARRAAGL